MNYKKKAVLTFVIITLVSVITMVIGVWSGKMPVGVQGIIVLVVAGSTFAAFLGSLDMGDDKKKKPDPTCPKCRRSVLTYWKHCPECGGEL